MKKSLSVLFALLLWTSLVFAVDVPPRRDGLWSIKTTMGRGAKSSNFRQCVTAESEAESLRVGKEFNEKNCTKSETRKEGEQYVSETDCTIGGKRIVSRSVITGNFKSTYNMKVTTTETNSNDKKSVKEMAMTGRYVGPCEPGQKPGSVEIE